MLVSILVNSYNYARFVGATIDSALRQTHPDTEVIVVDDGSIDGSWQVIESYGRAIRAARRPNGGQAAAYNAAMAMARGDCVLFLDSDDLLDRDAVEFCVAAMAAPNVVKVQFRLRLIDAAGVPLGASIPYLMHSGDVRPLVRDFGTYAGPPGSGNLYRRSAIAHCFPLETEPWRRGGADTVPYVACAFLGDVASLEGEHGSYRLHHDANAARGVFGNTGSTFGETLRREADVAARMRHFIERHHATLLRDPPLPTPTQLRVRCLSWKLERATHPCAGDSAARLIGLFGRVMDRWQGYSAPERWVLRAWLLMILMLPARLSGPLARANARGRAKKAVKWWARLLA